jgi:glycerol-3-phosphate dehydrogenase subunit C
MLKQEWPNYLPEDQDVKKLATNTQDICEYVVKLSKNEGLISGLQPVNESITLHFACHARAQNNGFKSRDMLKLIPGVKLTTVERCSGHGGSFGVKKVYKSITLI